MKKLSILILLFSALSVGYLIQNSFAMPNPWVECGQDVSCAAQKAGFNLPIRVKNPSFRAMDDMIEVHFSLSKNREVCLRKSQLFKADADEYGIKDISGVYNTYSVDKIININGVMFHVKGIKNKFYVVNFAAETGYYSFYCEKGLKIRDIKYLYKILEEAEAPRFDYENTLTIEQLQDLRRVDGIVEPIFTQDCFPKTLYRKGVTKDCFERANLGDDSFCTLSQVKFIKEYYKKGQDKDPLNNGSGNFCAD